MLKYRSMINFAISRRQLVPMLRRPCQIAILAALNEGIAEVGLRLQQQIQIAALMDIEQCSEQRPGSMIHPDPRNVVAISDKFTWLCSNNRSIASVDTDSGVIVEQQVSNLIRFHNH
ncbi:hypothetical protein D3C81_1356810 [compost metagenome]